MELKTKFQDWLMDIAKYVLTAVIISSFLAGLGEKWKIYVYGTLVAGLCIIGTVWLNKNVKTK